MIVELLYVRMSRVWSLPVEYVRSCLMYLDAISKLDIYLFCCSVRLA